MELWDLYTRDRERTGETMVRGAPPTDGRYHLVVHVCIFNSNNQMLIQQRQPFKSGWSNLWDVTVGGSAVAGDNSQRAAERDVAEELGYSLSLKDEMPALTLYFSHGFDDVYVLEREIDLNALRLQPEEVQAVRWASLDDIRAMIADGRFIPYSPVYMELLFSLHATHSFYTHGDRTRPTVG